jgi:ubiquinone biosynthesis accessory factor UbiJ
VIKVAVLVALEKAINLALALDNDRERRLLDLKNHTIKISLSDLSFDFYLSFTEKAVYVQQYCLGEPQLTIAGTLDAFISMATSKKGAVLPKEMEVMGSAHLAQNLQQFVADIDIDWEEHLSRLTGDTVATQISQLMKKGIKTVKRQSREFGLNLKEYLQEESELLVRQDEVDHFCHEVDELRHGVARLAAKVQQLEDTSNT